MSTLKQKKTFKAMVENGGNVSRAMRKSGYSSAMAKNPQKLTRSKGWSELMDEYLPDELLARKNLALLNKTETKRVLDRNSGGYVTIKTKEIDAAAVARGLDMAYKIKGKYGEPSRINIAFTGITLERPGTMIHEVKEVSRPEVEVYQ